MQREHCANTFEAATTTTTMVTTRQRVTVQIQCKYLNRIRSSNFAAANRKILSVRVCTGEEREKRRKEEKREEEE